MSTLTLALVGQDAISLLRIALYLAMTAIVVHVALTPPINLDIQFVVMAGVLVGIISRSISTDNIIGFGRYNGRGSGRRIGRGNGRCIRRGSLPLLLRSSLCQ